MKKYIWLGFLLTIALGGFAFVRGAANKVDTHPVDTSIIAEGHRMAKEHCAQCHAIGRSDQSQQSEAPPFRDIASRYSVWLLAESLAEGIVSGHPDMPEFAFDPDEINAILTYMDTLKQK